MNLSTLVNKITNLIRLNPAFPPYGQTTVVPAKTGRPIDHYSAEALHYLYPTNGNF